MNIQGQVSWVLLSRLLSNVKPSEFLKQKRLSCDTVWSIYLILLDHTYQSGYSKYNGKEGLVFKWKHQGGRPYTYFEKYSILKTGCALLRSLHEEARE